MNQSSKTKNSLFIHTNKPHEMNLALRVKAMFTLDPKQVFTRSVEFRKQGGDLSFFMNIDDITRL